MLEEQKECPGCRQTKPTAAFGKNRRRSDGLAYYCKACFQQLNKASYRLRAAKAGRVVTDRDYERQLRRAAPDGYKWCNDCQEFRQLEEFPRNRSSKDGRAAYCRDHQNERTRRSRLKVHGGSRHYHLVQRYGIGASEVEAMIARQNGLCLICLRPLGDTPHVDHCHDTGAVRGVLCFNCNGGLGQFRDDKDLLLRAARYLDGTLAS